MGFKTGGAGVGVGAAAGARRGCTGAVGAGFGAGSETVSWDTERLGIITIGFVLCVTVLVEKLSFLIGGSSFFTASNFTFPGLSKICMSSGAQNLQLQLSESPVSSAASHRTCGKKSAGLLYRFLGPWGWPYR